jgi:hypothetical protein
MISLVPGLLERCADFIKPHSASPDIDLDQDPPCTTRLIVSMPGQDTKAETASFLRWRQMSLISPSFDKRRRVPHLPLMRIKEFSRPAFRVG